ACKVVIEFVVEACTNRVSCRGQKKSIPICRRSYGRFRAYCATCASPMLYDELLAEPLRQPLTYEACEKVIRAAGCISNNDAHRSRRIIERRRDTRCGRQRGSTGGQMEKISTGKFHFESPSPLTSLDHLVGRGQSSVGGASMEWRRYFARRYVTLALPPIDGVGLKYVTSSPSNERMRVCVPPVKFGYVLPSMLTVSTFVASSIE